jgi:hypothetical protein
MGRTFLTRVFCLGPITDALRIALREEYGLVEITELPWQSAPQDPPEVLAARVYRAFEKAGGVGMTMGDRILCVPRALAALVYFLALVQRGDYGIPSILISDDNVSDGEIKLHEPDCAILALREMR